MRMDNPWSRMKLNLLRDVWIMSLAKDLLHKSYRFKCVWKFAITWFASLTAAAWVFAAIWIFTFTNTGTTPPRWYRPRTATLFFYRQLTFDFRLLLYQFWRYQLSWLFRLLLDLHTLSLIIPCPSVILILIAWLSVFRSVAFHRSSYRISTWLISFTFTAFPFQLHSIFTFQLVFFFLTSVITIPTNFITFHIAPTTTSTRWLFSSRLWTISGSTTVMASVGLVVLTTTPRWRSTFPFSFYLDFFPTWSPIGGRIFATVTMMRCFSSLPLWFSLVTVTIWARVVASSRRILVVFFLVRKFVGRSWMMRALTAVTVSSAFTSGWPSFMFVLRIIKSIGSSGG